MDIKDQLKIRMDELDISPPELARRIGVTAQSVRFWLAGRSYPGKAKAAAVETALSIKLNYSSGQVEYKNTVEDSLKQTDIETFLAITKLPPQLKSLFSKIAVEIAASLEPRTVPEIQAPSRAKVNARGFVVEPKKTR